MPSSTFLRLPEEKRQRLMEAAWAEFTRVPYPEASINRIIQQAQIPRGSFYQYFEDKNDLFLCLIDQIRDKFLCLLGGIMAQTHGDIFAIPVCFFDGVITKRGTVAARFSRDFALLRLNVSMDVQTLFFDRAAKELAPERLREYIDPRCLRQSDDRSVGNIFFFLVSALASAIAKVTYEPKSYADVRARLIERVDILKNGCGAQSREE